MPFVRQDIVEYFLYLRCWGGFSLLYIHLQNKMSNSRQFLEPLPLNYSLAKRKLRILIFWLLVFLDSFVLPIGLYYLLTRTTTWSSTTGMPPCSLCAVIINRPILFRSIQRLDSNLAGNICDRVTAEIMESVAEEIQLSRSQRWPLQCDNPSSTFHSLLYIPNNFF